MQLNAAAPGLLNWLFVYPNDAHFCPHTDALNSINAKLKTAANPAQRFLQDANGNVAYGVVRFLSPAHGATVDIIEEMIVEFFYPACLVAELGEDSGYGR
jgi:hypothetical protein